MNVDESFLQAICESPDDDAPRLIFADYLEESGAAILSARAEFIRVQCERSRLAEGDPRQSALVARESALLKKFRRAWNGPLHRLLQAGPLRGQMRSRGLLRGWNYRRGFVAEVTAHASVVVRHPDELLRLGPLEHLRVRQVREMLVSVLGSPLVDRVKELDLSGSELADDSIPLLLVPRTARLHALDLRRNPFSAAGRQQLVQAVRHSRLPGRTFLGPPPGYVAR